MNRPSHLNIALFCLIVLVLSSVIGASLSYVHHRETSIHTQTELLQLTAVEKATQVNLFLEQQEEKLTLLREMEEFREVARRSDDVVAVHVAKEKIRQLKGIISGISILTPDGIVIIGENDLPGMDYSEQPYFDLQVKHVVFERYYDSVRKNEYYAVVGPLYNDSENKVIIGVITFDVQLQDISALMSEAIDTGSDEVYLIDESGLMLSGSEYVGQDDKSGILVQEVDSDGAIDCLEDLEEYGDMDYIEEHEEETPHPYINYMGDDVYGAHAYVPTIMGCVLAENHADVITDASFITYLTSLFDEEEHEVPDEN